MGRHRFFAALVALGLMGMASWAQPDPPGQPVPLGIRAVPEVPPGGPVVLRAALRSEQGDHPRLVVQTVPNAQVTATVLAIRYRRPGENGGASASAAHLLEHMLYRSRAGSPPGALLVRAESLGGQNLAYLTSGVMVLGELVPSEHGLESLDLQLERLRALPSDAADLKAEKRSIAAEVASAPAGPEERARRETLSRLGVNAQVEGDSEALTALSLADLEKLLDGLTLERDVVIAVVGPHTDREVRQHLSKGLKKLRPAGTESQPRSQTDNVPGAELAPPSEVESPSGYQQASYFLALPELSTAELLLLEELLREAGKGRSTLALAKEDQGLYRLDVTPPESADVVVQRLRAVTLDDAALEARLHRRWLDRYEPALERAEMLALEALDRGTVSAPLKASELSQARQRLLSTLEQALEQAPGLQLMAVADVREGLYPFKARARATTPLQRQTLANGLSVVWQDTKAWPVVGISVFFRLRRPLSPQECAQLEAKLEARSSAGLDYEIKPDALFFHLWCPSRDLTQTLAAAAAEIRALSESSEVLVERAEESSPSALEDFFLAGLERPEPTPINGRALLYPEGGQLVLVGDIDPVALEHGLRPAWNGWFAEKPARPGGGATVVEPPQELQRTLPLPAGQASLLLVGLWGPNRSSPDFLAFNLALQTLAGRPTTSLLARELRDTEGLVQTVSVFPMSGSDRADGQQLWLVALRPRQAPDDATPLAAKVQSMLSSLSREPLPESELARTRAYLKAALKVSTSTARGRAKVLANSEFYRLSEQYSTDYAGLYDRIDAAQARAVWQKYLEGQTPRWLYLRPEK